MRVISLRRMSMVSGLVAAAGLLMGAGPVRIEPMVRGHVIDAETKAPVPGAVVRLTREATCPALHGHQIRKLPPVDSETDRAGHFRLRGGFVRAPCARPLWWTVTLTLLAPGYLMDPDRDTALYYRAGNSSGRATFELYPNRYQVDLDAYRVTPWATPPAEPPASRWASTLAAAHRVPVQPVGDSGVFASQSGAAFDRVAVIERGVPVGLERWVVVAQDRRSGALHGWTIKGTTEPLPALPPGASLLSGRWRPGGPEPLITETDRLHFARDRNAPFGGPGALGSMVVRSELAEVGAAVRADHWLVTVEASGGAIAVYDVHGWLDGLVPPPQPEAQGFVEPGRRLAVGDVLPGGQPPVTCVARVSGDRPGIVFIAREGTSQGVFFLVAPALGSAGAWRAERVAAPAEALPGEATACAGGHDAVYVAVRGQGIRKLRLSPPSAGPGAGRTAVRVEASVVLAGPSGPLTFVALAAGELAAGQEVLYAAAGDDAVYRFSADLRPDQRIAVALPSPGPSR